MGLLPMIPRRIQDVLFQTPQVARLKEQNEAPPHSPGVRSAPSSPVEIAPRGEECLSPPPLTSGNRREQRVGGEGVDADASHEAYLSTSDLSFVSCGQRSFQATGRGIGSGRSRSAGQGRGGSE